jgi:hypothetical protein
VMHSLPISARIIVDRHLGRDVFYTLRQETGEVIIMGAGMARRLRRHFARKGTRGRRGAVAVAPFGTWEARGKRVE